MIYLDNAASSHPKPPEVYEAADRMLRMGANPGRSGHGPALDAAREVLEARTAVAELLGVGDPGRITFTANGTHALNLALMGLLEPGDHVVSTQMEHNSVLRPLAALERIGTEVTLVSADRTGRVEPAEIELALRPHTRLVVLNHASNVCGTVQDAAAVGEICRRRGVLLLLDAAQTAGTLPLDVKDLGVDLLAAPGHKGLLGPQGTGVLYVAPGIRLRPLLVGGTGVLSESREMPPEMPDGLEAGTLNAPGLAGLTAGVRYLLQRGVAEVRRQEQELLAHLLPALESLDDVIVYGPGDPSRQVAVVSFNLKGRDGAHLGYALDQVYGIAVRVGLHCAPEAHRALGTFPGGTVRASLGPFNTRQDTDDLVRAVRELGALA